MADQVLEWQFGETEADAVAWMKFPATLHAYVDFRTPETPPGMWQRVMVVTLEWVREHVSDASGTQSWPALLIVPDSSLSRARKSIDGILKGGGWPVIARNSWLINEAERLSDG